MGETLYFHCISLMKSLPQALMKTRRHPCFPVRILFLSSPAVPKTVVIFQPLCFRIVLYRPSLYHMQFCEELLSHPLHCRILEGNTHPRCFCGLGVCELYLSNPFPPKKRSKIMCRNKSYIELLRVNLPFFFLPL